MLRILGSAKTLCDRVTRRDLLRLGGMGLSAAGLADLLKLRSLADSENPAERGFGKARRVIILYLYGGAAQHELWDMQPEGPAGIRGSFQPIQAVVPGIQGCE